MRYECESSGKPTKWFEIDILSLSGDNFMVVMSYGVKSPQGEDTTLQKLKEMFRGKYPDAETVLLNKIKQREQVGYKKVEEPKTEIS